MNLIFNVYKKFMHGFSYIIPLAVVGGVFLTLYELYPQDIFFDIGSTSFFLIYPVLAAFIAFSIGDKPGLILGLISGSLVALGESGFLGATIVGFSSGYLILGFNALFKKLPSGLKGLSPVFIYPVLGVFVLAFLIMGLEIIISPFNSFVNDVYINLGKIYILLIVAILSSMMAYGLGGPINKVAYVIAILTVIKGVPSVIMPSVMIAGMVPPLVIAFAVLLFRDKFSESELVLAKRNWLLGLSFITEGAIPFVKKDKKVMYVILVASIISGVVTATFNVSSLVAHGGILAIFFMDQWLYFIVTLICVTIIFGFILGLLLKKEQENT